MKAAILSAALTLTAATPAAATPGFVAGEGIGTIFLQLTGDPELDIALRVPVFQSSYSSFGSYHEDGYDTSVILDPSSIVLGFDLYAYAFSAPFVPTLHSEVNGAGYFVDGVFATIHNPTATLQHVEAFIGTDLSLSLNAEQPRDLTYGSISYRITGSGSSGSQPLSLSHAGTLPPSSHNSSHSYSLSHTIPFDLAPDERYSFSVQDFGSSFFLRAQAVPEPATWAMMITGFAAVGAIMRRSRRRITCLARVDS